MLDPKVPFIAGINVHMSTSDAYSFIDEALAAILSGGIVDNISFEL